MVLEDDAPAEPSGTPGSQRNLSAWTITIPYIDIYDDEVKRERIPVFCIDVERNDRKEGEEERLELSFTDLGSDLILILVLLSPPVPQQVMKPSAGRSTGDTWSSTSWSPN